MTPEDQRIAIAMACGMVVVPCTCCANPWKNLSTGKHIPDYLNDLNAMHEAENARFKEGNTWADYFDALQEICWDQNDPITATAAQRAESFLKTLNLWKDQ